MVAVAYRSWSFTRGSNCRAFNGKNFSVLDRRLLTRGGRTWRFDWIILTNRLAYCIVNCFIEHQQLLTSWHPKRFSTCYMSFKATFSFSSDCLTLFDVIALRNIHDLCHQQLQYSRKGSNNWFRFSKPTKKIESQSDMKIYSIWKPYPWINIRQKQKWISFQTGMAKTD